MFWTWAGIEVLRRTGARIEELLELTHLSLRQSQAPTGETVGSVALRVPRGGLFAAARSSAIAPHRPTLDRAARLTRRGRRHHVLSARADPVLFRPGASCWTSGLCDRVVLKDSITGPSACTGHGVARSPTGRSHGIAQAATTSTPLSEPPQPGPHCRCSRTARDGAGTVRPGRRKALCFSLTRFPQARPPTPRPLQGCPTTPSSPR